MNGPAVILPLWVSVAAFGLPEVAPPFMPAGAVPDGATVPGEPLKIAKLPDDLILLSWSPSCAPSDTDYAIYVGTLGDFASHVPAFCSTNGETTQLLGGIADHYYLVVPLNPLREGSYGLDSQGFERPPSSRSCLPQETGACRPSDAPTHTPRQISVGPGAGAAGVHR